VAGNLNSFAEFVARLDSIGTEAQPDRKAVAITVVSNKLRIFFIRPVYPPMIKSGQMIKLTAPP